jgi:hypothetical protein
LIAVYAFHHNEASQSFPASYQSNEPTAAIVRDPFKEFLDKQQQGASLQPSQALPIQTIQIGDRTSAATVPVGTDPFKAFLDAQPKAKPEEAAISPFSDSK